MAFARPFAYNTGASISGTTQVGSLAVGTPASGFTTTPQFWNGPDEELGWVIAQPVSGNTQPTPISGVTASVGFYRTNGFSTSQFINYANLLTGQSYTGGTQASSGLTSLGYWNNYDCDENVPSNLRYISFNTKTNTSNTTYTFSNVDIGSGNCNSLLVVLVESRDTSGLGNPEITGVTVTTTTGTAAMNRAVFSPVYSGGSSIFTCNAIFYIDGSNFIVTATTFTVTLKPTGSPYEGCSIGVYRLDGLKSTVPYFTGQTFVGLPRDTRTLTVNSTEVGDLIVGNFSQESAFGTTTSWTGLTENYDTLYAANSLVSGASTRRTSSGNLTITAKSSDSSSNPTLCVAAWR
jgi:hypothetical protein